MLHVRLQLEVQNVLNEQAHEVTPQHQTLVKMLHNANKKCTVADHLNGLAEGVIWRALAQPVPLAAIPFFRFRMTRLQVLLDPLDLLWVRCVAKCWICIC